MEIENNLVQSFFIKKNFLVHCGTFQFKKNINNIY